MGLKQNPESRPPVDELIEIAMREWASFQNQKGKEINYGLFDYMKPIYRIKYQALLNIVKNTETFTGPILLTDIFKLELTGKIGECQVEWQFFQNLRL